MTSPASFNTPARAIEYAMKDAGLLSRGDLPDSDQYAEYGNRLNDMINLWQTQGLKLWLNYDLPITLTQGVGKYTLGASGTVVMTKPMRIFDSFTINSGGTRRPLTIISRAEYNRLSNVTNQGALNSVFVDKQQTYLGVYFWMVPDSVAATDTAYLTIQQAVQNFTGLNDQMNFPQEWFMALRWGLADDICGGQSKSIMDRCQQRATTYRTALEDWDVEDASTFWQPDQRATTASNSFR